MAGIIAALGDTSDTNIRMLQQTFEGFKPLTISYAFYDHLCQILKYRRLSSQDDRNYFASQSIVLCVVGTLLYRHFSLYESIKHMGQDLTKGSSILEIVENIDGHYLVMMCDIDNMVCYLVTDVGGVIQTYFCKKDHVYLFSTSMLALARCLNVSINEENILLFLRSGMFFDEETYFNEIQVLKPASIYRYDLRTGAISRTEYWSIPKEVNEKICFDEAAKRITDSVYRIIEAIPTDKSIYDFTGGYDSRFVLSLAYAKAIRREKLNAFFFGPPSSREARIVENTCRSLGIRYNNYVPDPDWPNKFFDFVLDSHKLSDGMENACAYAPILMTQQRKIQNFQYSVHGLFGELFRQRTWEFDFGTRGKRRPANLRRLIKYRTLADDFDKSIFSKAYIGAVNDSPDKILKIYMQTNRVLDKRAPNTLQLDNVFFSHRARRWGGRNITTTNQMIQPICPLWFRRPLEISFSLRPEYRKRCKLMRHIVQTQSPRFARERMITNTPFTVMDFRTIYDFLPGAYFFVLKAIRKLAQTFLNKTIWAGLTTPDYRIGDWYRQALSDKRCAGLLCYDEMISNRFFEKSNFEVFVQRAKNSDFHFYGQLGNVITVELTLREATRR